MLQHAGMVFGLNMTFPVRGSWFGVCSLALFGVSTAFLCGDRTAGADEWPRFRGPNGAGLAADSAIPNRWDDDAYRWAAKLPGSGHSSPVVWGDRIFVTAADETLGTRWLICLNAQTGDERWRAGSTFKPYKKHKNNSFASSTPAVDAKHVYQLWHSKQNTTLIAYDHDGQETWRYDLGAYDHGQGGATSPIVEGDHVYVAHDHKANSFLVAVRCEDGGEAWKITRDGKRACYSTPCVRTTASGNREIVFVHCYEGVVGIDSKTGEVRWRVDPFGRTSQRALASPIVANEMIIAGSGAAGGERQLVAISVSEDLPNKAVERFRWIRQSPHVPSPIAIGNRLFLWNDGGIATCYDLQTGEKIWQNRIGGNYFASPIAIGDRLFSINTDGEVVIIKAADNFEVLGRNATGESSRASLAFSNDVLYIRTESSLFALPAGEQD